MGRNERCLPVAQEVLAALDHASAAPEYVTVLRCALSAPGGILSPSPHARWASFVLLTCESASEGRWRLAVPAAAALEVLAAALELFDDIEDNDGPRQLVGQRRAIAINVAYGLIWLAQACLVRAAQAFTNYTTAARCQELLAASGLRMGSGQHLDLASTAVSAMSEDASITIASLKSAELVKCACQIGAMLGTDDEGLIALYAQFGWHLGMFAQIINDIEAIALPERGKADIRQLKPTLPIAFWLKGENDRAGTRALQALARRDEAAAREAIRRSGALHYAWTVAEIHREQASQILQQLDSYRPASAMLGYLVAPVSLEALLGDR